jgi:hypothetical protein
MTPDPSTQTNGQVHRVISHFNSTYGLGAPDRASRRCSNAHRRGGSSNHVKPMSPEALERPTGTIFEDSLREGCAGAAGGGHGGKWSTSASSSVESAPGSSNCQIREVPARRERDGAGGNRSPHERKQTPPTQQRRWGQRGHGQPAKSSARMILAPDNPMGRLAQRVARARTGASPTRATEVLTQPRTTTQIREGDHAPLRLPDPYRRRADPWGRVDKEPIEIFLTPAGEGTIFTARRAAVSTIPTVVTEAWSGKRGGKGRPRASWMAGATGRRRGCKPCAARRTIIGVAAGRRWRWRRAGRLRRWRS